MIKRTNLPILVGPWRGEFGIETLYWIPWLNRLRADLNLDPARLIPIARGTLSLYGTPTGIELHGMRSAQDVRIANRIEQVKTGTTKPLRMTQWDRAVLKDAATTLKLGRHLVLHPAWMYQTLEPYFGAREGLNWLMDRLRMSTLPAPELPADIQLPERFVTARFYWRATFPRTPQTMELARAILQQVAEQTPVILLNSGQHVDEHADFEPKDIPNVLRLSDLTTLTPENNMQILMGVLAKSEGFVGTYGGLAQSAVFYQKPAVSFYTDFTGAAIVHKHLSDWLAISMNVPFHAIKVREIGLLRHVLPQMIVK